MRGLMLRFAILAVSAVASAEQACGQAMERSQFAPVCPSGAEPVVTTQTYTVALTAGTAWNRHVYSPEERMRILYHADAIREHFKQPADLGAVPTLGDLQQAAWGGELSPHAAVAGKLVLVMRPNGRMKTLFWQVIPLSKALGVAINNAAIAADSARAFEGIIAAGETRGDDTLVVQVRSLLNEPTSKDLPLMRAQLQSYMVLSQARVKKEGGLYYPVNAGDSRVENKGEIEVIVGSDGLPVLPTMQITRIEFRDFISTMRRAIEGTTYEPARSGYCAVPSVIRHTFDFSIRRP